MTWTVAVAVEDLMRLDDAMLPLVAGRVGQVVEIRRGDVVTLAAVIACDLPEACAVVDVIRRHDAQTGSRIADAFVRNGSSWRRLPGPVVLAQVVDDKVLPSPAVFGSESRAGATAELEVLDL